jgi:phosphoesterase RecJ-like protein
LEKIKSYVISYLLIGGFIKLNKKHQEIIKLIKETILDENNKKFILGAHVGPDGDNVGSTMALYYLLKSLGKEVTPYNPDEIPDSFKFLKDIDKYSKNIDKNEEFDVGIVVDNSDIKRIGDEWPINRIKTVIQVDHHIRAQLFGDIVYIDENAVAVGEILYFVIREILPELNFDIAQALYLSILTDSGSFRYSNTTPRTFFVAQKLLEAGAKVYDINIEVYEKVKFEKIALLKETLSTIEFNESKNFTIMYLTKDMFKKYDADEDTSEGFVNYGRIIDGVEVSCLLKEVAENKYKVSLRSKKFDLSKIAIEYFSGGGHKNAAGGRIEGKLNEIIEDLKIKFTEWLKNE